MCMNVRDWVESFGILIGDENIKPPSEARDKDEG
jgi:hypothetical protein